MDLRRCWEGEIIVITFPDSASIHFLHSILVTYLWKTYYVPNTDGQEMSFLITN